MNYFKLLFEYCYCIRTLSQIQSEFDRICYIEYTAHLSEIQQFSVTCQLVKFATSKTFICHSTLFRVCCNIGQYNVCIVCANTIYLLCFSSKILIFLCFFLSYWLFVRTMLFYRCYCSQIRLFSGRFCWKRTFSLKKGQFPKKEIFLTYYCIRSGSDIFKHEWKRYRTRFLL